MFKASPLHPAHSSVRQPQCRIRRRLNRTVWGSRLELFLARAYLASDTEPLARVAAPFALFGFGDTLCIAMESFVTAALIEYPVRSGPFWTRVDSLHSANGDE